MPNGGAICCAECTYSRLDPGTCDIFGTPTSGLVLCRAFRMAGQSHSAARDRWPLLLRLDPGIVYSIDNRWDAQGLDPRPIYRLRRSDDGR